jgi:Ca-activated chloride channel homolog
MTNRTSLQAFLFLLLSSAASAQLMSLGPASNSPTFSTPYQQQVQSIGINQSLWLIDGQIRSPLETPVGSVSKLDLKAPYKARRAYEKGYQLLLRKQLQDAVENLTNAISIYPSFVAAHNALGSAYLGLNQNDLARKQFSDSIALDDHLPNSYLNLGCADLALQDFPAAEAAIQKASAIAPLDLTLLTALAYGQLMNHDYAAVVSTVKTIHSRNHADAAIAHYFGAVAWAAQDKPAEARQELATLLKEDPKSPAAMAAVQMSEQLKELQERPTVAKLELNDSYSQVDHVAPSGPAQLPEQFQKLMQGARENAQIAEAESSADCADCDSAPPGDPGAPGVRAPAEASNFSGYLLRASADEVAIFFTATDHGKPITDLTPRDIQLRDRGSAPAAITGFRNEYDLPLRLGLVLDTSSSVTDRFKFEQTAAAKFVQTILTDPKDSAFVIGVSNSVLVVQDFTPAPKLLSHAVGELVPSGGTAIWDAVSYAADKLAARPEPHSVARVLVVISDGEDNSSSATLKQAVVRAQRSDVVVYTVCTRDLTDDAAPSWIGERALTTLSELTGGANFTPGSVHSLEGSLFDLQKIIRSRYLVSYKPVRFQRNGEYRTVDISAEKDGHKLRVYARKGYIAGPATNHSPSQQSF